MSDFKQKVKDLVLAANPEMGVNNGDTALLLTADLAVRMLLSAWQLSRSKRGDRWLVWHVLKFSHRTKLQSFM